jgi:hypothetical protein
VLSQSDRILEKARQRQLSGLKTGDKKLPLVPNGANEIGEEREDYRKAS